MNFEYLCTTHSECWISTNCKTIQIRTIRRLNCIDSMDKSNDFSIFRCTIRWITERIATIQGFLLIHFHLEECILFQNILNSTISKAPVPIRPWKRVYNAQNYGRKCPTLEDLNKLTENELKTTDVEDCLNMAIYSTNVRFHFTLNGKTFSIEIISVLIFSWMPHDQYWFTSMVVVFLATVLKIIYQTI